MILPVWLATSQKLERKKAQCLLFPWEGERKVLFSVLFLIVQRKRKPFLINFCILGIDPLKGCSDKTMKTHDSRAAWVLH